MTATGCGDFCFTALGYEVGGYRRILFDCYSDPWVLGSRRYADPATLLLPAEQWPTWRDEYCALVQPPIEADTALEQTGEQLQAALTELEPRSRHSVWSWWSCYRDPR